jgi:CubicO group peptidase (beta-lactamase class C family)
MIFLVKMIVQGQTIDRNDGTKITADKLQHKIEWLIQTANVQGLAISVFNNNKPVFSKTFGWANLPNKQSLTTHSVMCAASLSKMVFAYLVMQLVQQNTIDLDKPLVQYLDSSLVDYVRCKWNGFQDLAGAERYKKITARMCLNHTTGFANWRWFEPDQKLKIHFEPGSRYSYSDERNLQPVFVNTRDEFFSNPYNFIFF